MQIIHHCLVTRFRVDGKVIESFRGVDLIELKSEPYLCEDKNRKGWTFDIEWIDKDSEYYKDKIAFSEHLDMQYAIDVVGCKSDKKKLAKVEEQYKAAKEMHENSKFKITLNPHDENGNAYSEEHVRNIYNQVVEIKKLYSK